MAQVLIIANARIPAAFSKELQLLLGAHQYQVVSDPVTALKALNGNYFPAIIVASREFDRDTPTLPFVRERMGKMERSRTLFLGFNRASVAAYLPIVRGAFVKGEEEVLLKRAFEELIAQ